MFKGIFQWAALIGLAVGVLPDASQAETVCQTLSSAQSLVTFELSQGTVGAGGRVEKYSGYLLHNLDDITRSQAAGLLYASSIHFDGLGMQNQVLQGLLGAVQSTPTEFIGTEIRQTGDRKILVKGTITNSGRKYAVAAPFSIMERSATRLRLLGRVNGVKLEPTPGVVLDGSLNADLVFVKAANNSACSPKKLR